MMAPSREKGAHVETVTVSVLVFIITGALGALGGFVVATYTKFSKQVRAAFKLAKAQGRKEIVDAYQAFVVEGHKMTVERHRELAETYEAYTALGGNGTAKRLWAELGEIDPWIVTD